MNAAAISIFFLIEFLLSPEKIAIFLKNFAVARALSAAQGNSAYADVPVSVDATAQIDQFRYGITPTTFAYGLLSTQSWL
jgi:hypothetical protein